MASVAEIRERIACAQNEALNPQYFDPDTNLRMWARRFFSSTQYEALIKQTDERPHELPEDFVSTIAKVGLTGLELPVDFGGTGFTHQEQAVIMEESARRHAGLALNKVVLNSLTTHEMNKFATSEQKEKYLQAIASGDLFGAFALTEPERGSDAKGILTQAKKVDDGWEISGEKMFITLGADADFLIVAAKTDDESKRGKNITLFIVDTKDPVIKDRIQFANFHKVGQAGSPLYQISFDKVVVADEAILGGIDYLNRGWEILEDTLAHSRTWIAAQGVGLAQACFDEAFRRAQERTIFGKLQIDLEKANNMFHVMNRQISLARKLVQLAAYYEDVGHKKAPVVASLAKLVACETASWAATEATQLFGGASYLLEYKRMVELFLASPVLRIYEGAVPVQENILEYNHITPDEYDLFLPPKLGRGFYMNPFEVIDPNTANGFIESKIYQLPLSLN